MTVLVNSERGNYWNSRLKWTVSTKMHKSKMLIHPIYSQLSYHLWIKVSELHFAVVTTWSCLFFLLSPSSSNNQIQVHGSGKCCKHCTPPDCKAHFYSVENKNNKKMRFMMVIYLHLFGKVYKQPYKCKNIESVI